MDWSCPIVLDEIWGCLLTRSWLSLYQKMNYSSPFHMWLCISNVCSEMKRRFPLRSLYRIVERPYIDFLEDINMRALLVHCDFALNSFLQDVQDLSTMLNVEIVCAGGYAAWRLERHLQTQSGESVLPRSIRSTTFEQCRHMMEFWIPQDIDLYTTESDSELVILVLQESYSKLISTLWGAHAECLCAFLPGQKDDTDWPMDEEERLQSQREVMKHLENNEEGLSNTLLTQLKYYAMVSRTYPWRTCKTRKMWTLMCSATLGFEPHVVTVWNVEGKKDGESLSQMLTTSMCLSHCSVQLSANNGDWRYCGTLQSLQDVSDRRLRIVNTNCYRRLHRMLGHYLSRGFSFSCSSNPRGFEGGTFRILPERNGLSGTESFAKVMTITA